MFVFKNKSWYFAILCFFCQQNDSARLNVITSFTNLLIQFFTSCINLIVYTNHLGKRI